MGVASSKPTLCSIINHKLPCPHVASQGLLASSRDLKLVVIGNHYPPRLVFHLRLLYARVFPVLSIVGAPAMLILLKKYQKIQKTKSKRKKMPKSDSVNKEKFKQKTLKKKKRKSQNTQLNQKFNIKYKI